MAIVDTVAFDQVAFEDMLPKLLNLSLPDERLQAAVDEKVYLSRLGGDVGFYLPHCRMLQTVQQMVIQLAGAGLLLKALLVEGVTNAISKKCLQFLLEACSAVESVIVWSNIMYDDFIARVGEHRKPTTRMVEATRLCGLTLDALDGLLSSPDARETEARTSGLCLPLGTLTSWSACIRKSQKTTAKHVVDLYCELTNHDAAALETCLPKWEVYCTVRNTNMTMLKSKVLENPHKNLIEPRTTALHSLVAEAVKVSVLLALSPQWEADEMCIGAQSWAEGAERSAYKAMVVTAAANCLINLKGKAQAPTHAKHVIAAMGNMPDFELPAHCASLLKEVADVVPEGPPAKRQRTAAPTQEPTA